MTNKDNRCENTSWISMTMEVVHLIYNIKINLNKGAIGVEELEEPLLALGLVNSREEVVALMSKVDKDNQITFEEFLTLMSNAKSTSKQKGNKIQDFFKDMIKGEYDKHMDQNIAFRLNVSQFRR